MVLEIKKESLAQRMKSWENTSRFKLEKKIPVIMRLDGKNFSKLTKNYNKPFDEFFKDSLVNSTLRLLKEIQGANLAYLQSDEISILITDFESENTDAWFDYNIQKISSVSASMMSVYFSGTIGKEAFFDCRIFNLPKEEISNYFIWRQQDWERNSVSMLAQSLYSHRDLQNKNRFEQLKMIELMNDPKFPSWELISDCWKYGTLISELSKEERESTENSGIENLPRFIIDNTFEKFINNRNSVEKFLKL